jgi:hypothetical protein
MEPKMLTKTFGTLDKYGNPLPKRIEFEDGSSYEIPENPGGGGDYFSIQVPGYGVVQVSTKDIILE